MSIRSSNDFELGYIRLPNGFEITGCEPIDKRLVLTEEEMASVVKGTMPDIYFCICSTDKKFYTYDKSLASSTPFVPIEDSLILDDIKGTVDGGEIEEGTTPSISQHIILVHGTQAALTEYLQGDNKLAAGEPAAEINANDSSIKFKIGDSNSNYADLPYVSGGSETEVGVILGYYYNGEFYQDESHTTKLEKKLGKIYKDVSTGLLWYVGYDESSQLIYKKLVEEASSAIFGLTKLYSDTGSNTDGAITQAKTTELLGGKANTGTYTTSDPGEITDTAHTGDAGGGSVTSTITLTYDKTSEVGGGYGWTPSVTEASGSYTIDFSNASFTGTPATISATVSYKPEGTISGSITIPAHTHEITYDTATVNSIESISEESAGAHTHNVTGIVTAGGSSTYTPSGTISEVTIPAHSHSINHETASLDKIVTDINFTSGSLTPATATTVVTAVPTPTLTGTPTVMYAATVSDQGVLSFICTTLGIQSGSPSTCTVIPNYTYEAPSLSFSTSSITYVSNVDGETQLSSSVTITPTFTGNSVTFGFTGTAEEAGAHSHTITATYTPTTVVTGNISASSAGSSTIGVSGLTFIGTFATINVSADYTPGGSITGTQDVESHTHGYTAPYSHTHTLTYATVTATGEAVLDLPNHSHTMGHTHTVTLTTTEDE